MYINKTNQLLSLSLQSLSPVSLSLKLSESINGGLGVLTSNTQNKTMNLSYLKE